MGRFLNCLKKETILQDIKLTNKDELLQAISGSAKKSPILEKYTEQQILTALKERELLGTTGFGEGIAIPHCRLPNINDFVIGVITSKTGIDFESLDGRPVHLFVFIIAPEHETNEHIRLLSAISRICQNKKTVNEIIYTKTPDELIEYLTKQIHSKIDKKEIVKSFEFTVATGNTGLFQEILKLFTTLESSSIYITEARQAREYLSEMPLFIGFWGDSIENPWQIIHATIEKHFVNDLIRKIENVTGNLNSREDISVTVKELYYSSGILRN